MTRPLEGIKVLELAEHGFVPSSCAVLADWGAEVVKVERPEGDPLRGIQKAGLVMDTGDFEFLVEQMNRNKRGVSIDLRVAEGRDVFERLVRWADVFVTNFLPSARQKLRVEPDDLFAINPRLVYARGHGQGQRGAEADAGGFDAVSFWSRGAVAHMLTPPQGPVIMQRPGQGDIPSGMFLAGGIAAGLLHRERTGEGVVVDVSLLAGACWTLSPDLVATSAAGTEPPKMDTSKPLPSPTIGTYATADGRWLMLNMLDADRYWEPACRALGLAELLDDARFASAAGRAEHATELRDRFAAAIGAAPLADTEARLTAEECIFSKMASPAEVLVDPQVEANGYLPRHPTHATARLAASPVQFDSEPVEIRRGAPRTGEHTDEVLTELGLSADDLAALRAARAIL